MSILLEISKRDWFINLNASDYPLVSQGGMVSVGIELELERMRSGFVLKYSSGKDKTNGRVEILINLNLKKPG
ncbi:hypothetical protein F8388_013977 [Cannabis sativa]|uniref:Uncharacterized protein n=1 Tax=Cannabis sativa TaxID=3483 RepID=A0A7J6F878_CANSA|nr:hypothetical protein F8388_013977 [Cannabis sativa]